MSAKAATTGIVGASAAATTPDTRKVATPPPTFPEIISLAPGMRTSPANFAAVATDPALSWISTIDIQCLHDLAVTISLHAHEPASIVTSAHSAVRQVYPRLRF